MENCFRRARVWFVVWASAIAPLLPAAPFPVKAPQGMVVSSHHLASEVGVAVLKRGGNAVDAAVAMGFALAVVLPMAGNIGGGGFMVVHLNNSQVTSFDFREKAPAKAHKEMFLNPQGEYLKDSNHEGFLAVGVPGAVAGLFLAHQRLGRLPISELIEPARYLAEVGFQVTEKLAADLEELAPRFREYPSTARVFLKSGRDPYQVGDILRQPDLARTLGRIQERGRDGFYRGQTARLIAKTMRDNGGLITEEDLANYQARERRPIHGTYRGYDVYSMPPPSSGGVALVEMLNILEGLDLKSQGFGSAQHLHWLAESMRRAFADRARFLGDPDFNADLPIERLTSKSYAEQLRKSIRSDRASPSHPERFNDHLGSEETTHYSVVDSDGNAVSTTVTLEALYGSKIVVEGAGFLLNNEMGDFNPQPGRTDAEGMIGTPANLVAPGKRMLSSMTPTIVAKSGRPLLAIGSPGGRSIINTVLQVVVNMVDFGMDIAEAIAAPRIHHQWLPNRLRVERYGVSPDTLKSIEMFGHEVEVSETSRSQGRANGIWVDAETGLRLGAADPRSHDGLALGY